MISSAAPAAEVVKGWTIADRYPPGLLRSAGDLDVVCPAGQLWVAVQALLAAGWEFGAFTIFPERPGSVTLTTGWHVLVEVVQPADSPYFAEFYGVELRTADVATSAYRPALRLADVRQAPVAANILALAAERWERPARTRDVYDLAVLSDDLDQAQARALRSGLAATGLGPELLELVALLRRSGLAQAQAGADRIAACLPAGTGGAWASARRLARWARVWANPVRAAGLVAMSTVDADRGAVADRLAQLAARRTGCWRLLRAGLPLFAVPLDDVTGSPGGDSGVTLIRRGPHLVASTPIGRFLMAAASVPQAWLDEAREVV